MRYPIINYIYFINYFLQQNCDVKWPIFVVEIVGIISIIIIVDHITNRRQRTQHTIIGTKRWTHPHRNQHTTKQMAAVKTAKVIAVRVRVRAVAAAVAVPRNRTVQVIQIHQIAVKAHTWVASVIMLMNALSYCWKMNAPRWPTSMKQWTIQQQQQQQHSTKLSAHKNFRDNFNFITIIILF